MKNHMSIKRASAIGMVGSAMNVGLEYAAVRHFGGRAPLADMPHQAADVFAYGAVYVSRFTEKARHKLERTSSWLVSLGSFMVASVVAAETAQKFSEHGAGLGEQMSWAEPVVLVGVLSINGAIHVAQDRAHRHNHADYGAHVNHVHARSEWYATAALVAGTAMAVAADTPLLERAVAVAAAAWVGYSNTPKNLQAYEHSV